MRDLLLPVSESRRFKGCHRYIEIKKVSQRYSITLLYVPLPTLTLNQTIIYSYTRHVESSKLPR